MEIKEGDRVELVKTEDRYTDLEKGDQGLVTEISDVPAGLAGDESFTQIWVEWDNGSSLAMIKGEDRIKVVESVDENREKT